MKVEANKIIFNDEESYKIVKLKSCCDGIMESKVIDLSYEYDNGDDSDYSFNIVDTDYDDEIGYMYTYEKIQYCPFCGSKIVIDINTIDKTEEFNRLDELAEDVNKKIRSTDSIKKRRELHEDLREIRDKINMYYNNDSKESVK